MQIINGSFCDKEKNFEVVSVSGLKNVRVDCRGKNNKLIIENKYLHDTVIRFIGDNNVCVVQSCNHSKPF